MPALTEAQLEQFNREGFLVVEDIYDKERDFGPIRGRILRVARFSLRTMV